MVQVELKTGRAGVRLVQSPGDIIDVPEDEAQRMIAKGHAVLVDETAMVARASERAVRPPGRPRKA